MPPLYRWWGSFFRWVGAFHIREADDFVLLSNMGVTYPFHSPHFVWPCLPWPSSVIGCIPLGAHYPPASMGIDIIPSALNTCSFWSLQPNHITCGLHPSSVDALVDVHGRSCNFPFFHPKGSFTCRSLGDHLTTFLLWCPLFLPPTEVVLCGVGLVTCPMYDSCPYTREQQSLMQ